ncbi:MAG: FecR domain-containing protein [Kiritimatiellae bacterium]|nr:FecR domain-containing protein [Kiritimatiellia bacterium]
MKKDYQDDSLDYLLVSWASAREAEPAALDRLADRIGRVAEQEEARPRVHKTAVVQRERRPAGERYMPARGLPWGWQITGLAATLLVAIGILVSRQWAAIRPLERSEATVASAAVEQVQGRVYRMAEPLKMPWKQGQALAPGESVLTLDENSRAVVTYANIMRLEIGPKSVVQVGVTPGRAERATPELFRRTTVKKGLVSVDIRGTFAENPFAFVTPHAEVAVVGTRFTLDVAEQATRVAMKEGKARLTNRKDGKSVLLGDGQTAVVSATIAVSGRSAFGKEPLLPADPASIQGLALWLKADAWATYRDGQPVQTWPDRSGNGLDAVQPVPAKQPLYVANALNGRPILRFDGRDDSLQGRPPSGFHDCTLFVVFLPVNYQRSHGVFSFSRQGAEDWCSVDGLVFTEEYFPESPKSNLHLIRDTREHTHPDNLEFYTSAPADRFVIFAAMLVQGTAGVWLNGGEPLQDAYANTEPLSPTRYSIGSRINGVRFEAGEAGYNRMDLAEIIFYTRALTHAERQAIELYLSRKYAIPLDPSGQPVALRP